MNVGQIALGQPISVEAFAKVEGADVSKAAVTGMLFRMYEGNPAAGRVNNLPYRADQPVTVVEPATSSLVRYRAEWTVSPQLEIGKEYRLTATPRCEARTAAIQQNMQRVVLAERDANVGFFGQIINFFAGLFGRGSEIEDQGVQLVQEPSGPLQAIGSFFNPQQSQKKDQLQLDTFVPAQMEDEACGIVKFKFSFN